MRVVFCCLGDFKAPPGARQILLLARELQRRGHECLVLVEGDPTTVDLVGGGAAGVHIGRYAFAGPRLTPATRRAVRAFAPDVVHCYEPRTAPLAAALELSRSEDVPLVVRFADDDELLFAEAGGSGWRRRLGRPALMTLGTVVPRAWPYKHPIHHRRMLRRAEAYDAITPALAAEVARRYSIPCTGILPAISSPEPPITSPGLRARLGLSDGPLVLYTGSVFRPHYPDFELLLRAFGSVRETHPDAVLVHTGRLADRYRPDELRHIARSDAEHVRFLGFLDDPADLEALLAEAAVLTQPGAPNDFNRLRLPAKVHDYLLARRPTVTFAVGFGELLDDRVHAVLTRTADPDELAEAIAWVLADGSRAERVADAGRGRALELFDPEVVVAETLELYRQAGARGTAMGGA